MNSAKVVLIILILGSLLVACGPVPASVPRAVPVPDVDATVQAAVVATVVDATVQAAVAGTSAATPTNVPKIALNTVPADTVRTAQANGRICALAFVDQDGNGARSSDEPLLAGIGFTLSNDIGRLGTYNTDGTSEPYCFGNLVAGQYVVQARQPIRQGEATTPGQWAIPLGNGAQYDVAFGVRVSSGGSSTTPVPTTGNKCIDENSVYFKDLGVIYYKDWYDLQNLEAKSSGLQKASIIAQMQDLRRRAASLTPTACAKTHHDLFITYLDKTINYYILAANGADMNVQLQAAREAADAHTAFLNEGMRMNYGVTP